MGYRLALPDFASARAAATARAAEDPNVTVKDGVQVISMKLTSGPSFYAPSDIYTVKAGMPVRLVVNGIGTGCRGVLQVPKARVSVVLNKPVNVLEFTPTKPGPYVFSCSMGMFPGTLNVLPNA
jgi:plastocyanin domain-containing protein